MPLHLARAANDLVRFSVKLNSPGIRGESFPIDNLVEHLEWVVDANNARPRKRHTLTTPHDVAIAKHDQVMGQRKRGISQEIVCVDHRT
jgi:hypothetical protein